jgi:hypothetical protein
MNMNAMTGSWNRVLAAAALVAFVGTMTGGGMADDPEPTIEVAPLEEGGRAEQENRERQEVAERERAAREDQQRLQDRLERMRLRIQELLADGKDEEAANLERERNGILRELEHQAEARRGGPGEARDVCDAAERRLQHMRVAIDNLHAAGLHELAERVNEEIIRFVRERRECVEAR